MLLAAFMLLALTRAEIVQRMHTPVITRADGLVRVFANCPDDMCRDYQSPVARFAADTIERLYRAEKMRPKNFTSPQIIVHLGDVRTNLTDVVTRVATNDAAITTRIYLKSPGGADVHRFQLEIARGFYRAVKNRELTESEAEAALEASDPRAAVLARRRALEAWLAGDRSKQGLVDDAEWDEQHLTLMRKILEPGVASRRDVLTFASRLYLYLPRVSDRFVNGEASLSFADALELAPKDIRVRFLAHFKSAELIVFGGGRSAELKAAAQAYAEFLTALAKNEKTTQELKDLLLNADMRLRLAWETAK